MNTKSIVFTAARRAELLEETLREPRTDEVMVRLAMSSLSSGTERANLIGEVNVTPFERMDHAVFPRRAGYSSSGVVEAVGSGVSSLHEGDRVALSWSTHSEHVLIDPQNVYPLPDSVSFSDGAMLHIAAFPLAAIRKCRLEAGESALVMGLGVLGLCALPLLRAMGAVPIIAADPVPEKREKALQCGADYALDPYARDFADTVKKLTGGGARVAVEVTGVGAGLQGVLNCMARFGRVALLGCTRHSDFNIDYYRMVHGPGITLVGAHTKARPDYESSPGLWTLRDDMDTLIHLCEYGRILFSPFVDEIHSPNEVREVYDRLMNNGAFPLIQFDWRRLQ